MGRTSRSSTLIAGSFQEGLKHQSPQKHKTEQTLGITASPSLGYASFDVQADGSCSTQTSLIFRCPTRCFTETVPVVFTSNSIGVSWQRSEDGLLCASASYLLFKAGELQWD